MLATAGRDKNIIVIFVKHNLFQQKKWSRTIDLNTTHIIFTFALAFTFADCFNWSSAQ